MSCSCTWDVTTCGEECCPGCGRRGLTFLEQSPPGHGRAGEYIRHSHYVRRHFLDDSTHSCSKSTHPSLSPLVLTIFLPHLSRSNRLLLNLLDVPFLLDLLFKRLVNILGPPGTNVQQTDTLRPELFELQHQRRFFVALILCHFRTEELDTSSMSL